MGWMDGCLGDERMLPDPVFVLIWLTLAGSRRGIMMLISLKQGILDKL